MIEIINFSIVKVQTRCNLRFQSFCYLKFRIMFFYFILVIFQRIYNFFEMFDDNQENKSGI